MRGVGDIGANETDDGQVAILMVTGGLTVELSTDNVAQGDDFTVSGTASSDYVEIVAISPKGGNGTGIDSLYGVSIYTVPTFIASDALSDSEIAIKEKGNDVVINASKGKIIFDMPLTFVIGENLAINGTANTGNSVDIAMDDIIKAVDIPIENGTFYTEISTVGYTGSYKIEGFIDGNYSVGEDVSGKESDGSTVIRLIAPSLTVNISTNILQPGETLLINGTATGTDHVDIITISPKGGCGAGLYEKSYPGVPGRDGYYGNWYSEGVNTSDKRIKQIIDDYYGGDASRLRSKTQEQILAILQDATIDMVGSDDLACVMELTVGRPGYNFYKKIKVDSDADTGNYTILVLSPGIDGVYGDPYYSYFDSILDLDGAGPEFGAIDVSNKTQEELVGIIKNVTIDQAGNDDLLWMGHLIVCQPDVYVDDDFEDDPANHTWNTVQEGVDDANDGDTIYVYSGDYNENVIVNKSITLMGENKETTIINGSLNGNQTKPVINITADSCTITGFTITNGNIGVLVSSSNNITIVNNRICCNYIKRILGPGCGIYLLSSNNSNIRDNDISKNSGITICIGPPVIIKNLATNNNSSGIYLESSFNNNLIENNISDTPAIHLQYSFNNNIIKNSISNSCCGIYLVNSSNNSLNDNFINARGDRMGYGFHLINSSYNDIKGNSISNKCYGIYLESFSRNNIVTRNDVLNNYNGIYLLFSSENMLYLNNFVGNSDNVCSLNSTNIWNSPSPITYTYKGTTYTNYLGNYRDDYTGSDTDRGGIGDTPYSINSDNDSYPLMEPFKNYYLPIENIFDTGSPANPYPSIFGTHNGTIIPNQTITVPKLYTYPCEGTGGHTEYAAFYYTNGTVIAEAHWNGYKGDWHNISFNASFTLEAGVEYNYALRTGSYPQIHHTDRLETVTGVITCTEFSDANRKSFKGGIPAIRLCL